MANKSILKMAAAAILNLKKIIDFYTSLFAQNEKTNNKKAATNNKADRH